MPRTSKGTFCVSLDTELLWGRHDQNCTPFIPRAQKTRSVIKKLLEMFEEYQVPATWAVVGALYQKPTSKKHSRLWHAPDIVIQIKSTPNQELACHSYTHREFTLLNPKEAEAEIIQCVKLAKKENIYLKSFVFPRNKITHLSLLKKFGFICFRGEGQKQSKIKELLNLLFLIPQSSIVKKDNNLLNIPGSMYFLSCRGPRRFVPMFFRTLKAKRGINQAIKKNQTFHLWFHPIDFADNSQAMLSSLESIIKYAKSMEKQGFLEIKSMKQIALKNLK